jgi:hypothetical protein
MKTILSLFLIFYSFNIQAQQAIDTIKVRQDFSKIYFYEGKKLKPKQLLELMQPNPAAYREMKRAKTNYDVGSVFGFAGGFLLGYSLGSLILNEELEYGAAALGAGLIVISIPFSIGQAKHTKKAVKLYNEGVKATISCIQFRINCTNNKIGIVANF